MLKLRRGFTLIELVIVIAILGILAGIAIPRFLDAQASARGSKLVADLRTIDSACTFYMTKTGKEPTNMDQLVDEDTGNVYLASVPTPPSGDMLIRQHNDEEKSFTASDTVYKVTRGRATYTSEEGSNKTVDFYLGLDSMTPLQTELAKMDSWIEGYNATSGDIIAVQKAWLAANGGTGYKLTQDDLLEMMGAAEVARLPKNTDLYLRVAGVMINGQVQPVYYVSNHDGVVAPNNNMVENMRSYAMIIDGKVYTTTRGTSTSNPGAFNVGAVSIHNLATDANTKYSSLQEWADNTVLKSSNSDYFKPVN